MNYRCFDLGGGGLKTCIYGMGEGNCNGISNIGVSEHDDVAHWIRERIPTLDTEVCGDFVFTFSLAGLDKLSKSRRIENCRDSQSISQLFRLPLARVATLNDGDAHLLASRTHLMIDKFPQINFSVGTGVGIGMYDEVGNLVPEFQLTRMLGRSIWDFITDCSASKKHAWFALAKNGYEELCVQDPTNAQSRFVNRWIKFLQHKLLPALSYEPSTVTFTGGIIDAYNMFEESRNLQGCHIMKGPRDGGLLGAKYHAEQLMHCS